MTLLVVSPWPLFDTRNGASVAMRSLLETLPGVPAHVVSDCFLPDEAPLDERQLARQLRRLPDVDYRRPRGGGAGFWSVRDGERVHWVVSPDASASQTLASRRRQFGETVAKACRELRPTVALLIFSESHAASALKVLETFGVPTLLFVLTATYLPSPALARRAARVVSCSQYAATTIAKALGVPVDVAYPIVAPRRYRAAARARRFVTFINPVPQKGLTLVARLVEQASRHLPDAQFLIVEGRATRSDLREWGLPLEGLPNITFMENQHDMRTVYARTRVLLFPSFCPEAFGMCAVEAQANGIPVLASARGGIPEAINGAAQLLPVPRRLLADHTLMPTAAEARPWLAALERLLTDPAHYRRASAAARKAAAPFHPTKVVEQYVRLIRDVTTLPLEAAS